MGPKCAPSILCFRLSRSALEENKIVNIWGYSVYKGVPGFRTLGVPFAKWIEEETERACGTSPRFYLSLDDALERLRKILTPEEPPEE